MRRGEPSRWGSIGIAGWPKGDVSGRFRYAVDTRQRQSRGRLDAVMGASELAGWQVDSAGVTVTFPGAGPDSFRVRASRRGGSFELDNAESKEKRIKDSGFTEPSAPTQSAASVSPRRIASTPS